MSQILVTGPCEIFVALGPNNGLEFLGWSEDEVRVSLRGPQEPVYADFGGPAVAVDSQFMGEDATWGVTLIRYNEAVLNRVTARRRNGVIGFGEFGSIGSLMLAEGFAWQTVLFSPYVQKPIFANTMNPGYNFPASFSLDVIEVPITTRAKRPRVLFQALPFFEVVNNALVYTLYNTTIPALPSIN